MSIRRFLWAGGAATLLLAGCGGGQAASPAASAPPASAAAKPSASTAPASAAAKPSASAAAKPAGSAASGQASAAASGASVKLTMIVSTSQIDTEPQWAARDGGYFAKNGLNVDLQVVAGGTKTVAAMLANQAQVSIQGGNEAMSADAGGAHLVLIGNVLPIYAFKLEARAGINSVADLKGKKLGVSTIGGTADIALRTFLRKHNVDPDKDVTIVATGDPATSQAALVGGAVDAALSVPPNSLKAEAAGLHPLADLATEKIPNAQGSITVTRTWLDANKPVAQKLIDAEVESLVRIKHDKAFAEQLMKTNLKLTDQKALDETYDFFANEVWPDYPDITADQLATGLDELSKKNDKLKNFDPSSIIDDSFVQDAKKRNVAKQVS